MQVNSYLERFKIRHEAEIEEISHTLHLIWKSKTAMLGLIIISIFIFIAIFAPLLLLYPADVGKVTHPEISLQPPSWSHPFGTDQMGRDIFTRIIWGSRLSLIIGLSIVTIGGAIGIYLGLISGFLGGKIDELIMRLTDIFLSMPRLVLAILVSVVLGRNTTTVILALSFTWWGGFARLTRGVALSLKEREFVEAARMVGSSNRRIIFRHILPNSLSPLIVKATLDMGTAMLSAASLGFLGLGAPPPTPEWGLMVSESRYFLPYWWWYGLFPGIAIALVVLGFMLFGDGIRDVMDPKLRRR